MINKRGEKKLNPFIIIYHFLEEMEKKRQQKHNMRRFFLSREKNYLVKRC